MLAQQKLLWDLRRLLPPHSFALFSKPGNFWLGLKPASACKSYPFGEQSTGT
jgi:hypothetical protein